MCEQVLRHLSRTSTPASLLDVRAQPFSVTSVVAAIAASATTGALLAMGRRAGRAVMPFAAIGAVPLSRTNIGIAGLAVAGGLLHIAAMFVWASVYVWLAERTKQPVVTAIVVAVVNFLVSWLVTWGTGRGIASVLPLGDRVLYAVILAGAYVAGMRYALPASRNA
jgi:hypothetical protein